MFLTAYVKLVMDDEEITILRGEVLFGGWYSSHAEAEQAARECVVCRYEQFSGCRTPFRGQAEKGVILPRVFTVREGESLFDALYRANDWFEVQIASMNDAARTIRHTRKHC